MKKADKAKLKNEIDRAKSAAVTIMDFFSPKVRAKGRSREQVNPKESKPKTP